SKKANMKYIRLDEMFLSSNSKSLYQVSDCKFLTSRIAKGLSLKSFSFSVRSCWTSWSGKVSLDLVEPTLPALPTVVAITANNNAKRTSTKNVCLSASIRSFHGVSLADLYSAWLSASIVSSHRKSISTLALERRHKESVNVVAVRPGANRAVLSLQRS